MNVFATSPAHAPAREARPRIEAIAARLRESGAARLDRRGVAERLSRALRALYSVLDTTLEAPAHQDGLDECARALGEAKALLVPVVSDPAVRDALELLEATLRSVIEAREAVIESSLGRRAPSRMGGAGAGSPPARPFQASVALPSLHVLAREPVGAPLVLDALEPASEIVPRPKPPPKPATLEELRAAAAAASAPPAEPPPEPDEPSSAPAVTPLDDGEVIRRVARECLEDIAGLHVLRKPIPTETWLDQAPFEQRLLDNVDAFVSLGPRALASATLFHAEAPAPDPSRAFAVALTLGSIDGTDTVDVVLRTMAQSPPAELPGFAEALILAPSPAIDAELPALLDAPNPALAGVAIDVLGARGTLPLDAPERVRARRDRGLNLRLAQALGRAGARTRALAVLNDLVDESPDDADLFAIACESLLRRGDPAVHRRLRTAARDPRGFVLLAIAGRAEDAPLLLDAFGAARPTPAAIRALGRYGSPEVIPSLLTVLADEERAAEAAAALDLLTNAGLVETTEVPWTTEAPPDGAPPPMRKVTVPIAAPEPWLAWYARTKGQLDPRMKLRHGRPFVPAAIAAELGRVGPAAGRDEAALELVVATGLGTRLSTTDWVAKQTRQLSEITDAMPSLGGGAGGFWYAGTAHTVR